MSRAEDLVYLLEEDLERFLRAKRGEAYDLLAFGFDEMRLLRYVVQNKVLNLPNPVFFYQNDCKDFFYELDSLVHSHSIILG